MVQNDLFKMTLFVENAYLILIVFTEMSIFDVFGDFDGF